MLNISILANQTTFVNDLARIAYKEAQYNHDYANSQNCYALYGEYMKMSATEYSTPTDQEIKEYVKWLYERPTDNQSPYKNAENVVFLAGNFGGKSKYSIKTPGAREFIVGVYVAEDSKAESPNFTPGDLLASVEEGIQAVKSKNISVDGKGPDSLGNFLVKPTDIELNFPKNNVYGVPPGPTSSAFGGYFVKIRNVSPGPHEIIFSSEASYSNKPKYNQNNKPSFEMNVTHDVNT
jgi:hypothetical protein